MRYDATDNEQIAIIIHGDGKVVRQLDNIMRVAVSDVFDFQRETALNVWHTIPYI